MATRLRSTTCRNDSRSCAAPCLSSVFLPMPPPATLTPTSSPPSASIAAATRLLGALEVGDVAFEEVAADRLGDVRPLGAGAVEDGDLRSAGGDSLRGRPGHARCSSDDHHPCAIDVHAFLLCRGAVRIPFEIACGVDRTAPASEVTRPVFVCENVPLIVHDCHGTRARDGRALDHHSKGTTNVRSLDHRRLPHAPWHRQARQGCARPPAPAAPRRDGARGDRRAQRPRHRRRSTTSSGARATRPARRAATSAAWPRSTPATTSRRVASRSTASAAAASPRRTSPPA